MLSLTLLMSAAAAATAQPALAPFEPLVGHCWRGDAPGGQGIDTHCFKAVYGGEHIRDRHSVTIDGKEVYSGESLYSAKGTEVIFTYWNSLGGLGTGSARLLGDAWRFSGSIHATAAGAEQTMQAVWTIVPDGYQVSEGDGDKPRLFKRVN